MTRYLLDTNHLSEAMNRVSAVRDRVQRQYRLGDIFGSCGPMLCELQIGLDARRDAQRCRTRLDSMLRVARLWPIDRRVSEGYASVYHELRSIGRVLSQVDMMLAALARTLHATLLTTDQDFQALPDIQIEDWTV